MGGGLSDLKMTLKWSFHVVQKVDRFFSSLKQMKIDPNLTKFEVSEDGSGVWDPRSSVRGPRSEAEGLGFGLWEAKSVVRSMDFPFGRSNFDLWEVKTGSILTQFGVWRSPNGQISVWEPSLEKGAEF